MHYTLSSDSVPHLTCRRTEGTSTTARRCCGVFRHFGAGFKTADLLTYLLLTECYLHTKNLENFLGRNAPSPDPLASIHENESTILSAPPAAKMLATPTRCKLLSDVCYRAQVAPSGECLRDEVLAQLTDAA